MVMADRVVSPLLPLSNEAVVVELVVREILEPSPPRVVAFQDGEREAGNAAFVDFIRSEGGGVMDGVVVGGLGARQVQIPVIPALVHNMKNIQVRVSLKCLMPPLAWGWWEPVGSFWVLRCL